MSAGPSLSSAMLFAGTGPSSSLAVLAVLTVVLVIVAAWALVRGVR